METSRFERIEHKIDTLTAQVTELRAVVATREEERKQNRSGLALWVGMLVTWVVSAAGLLKDWGHK